MEFSCFVIAKHHTEGVICCPQRLLFQDKPFLLTALRFSYCPEILLGQKTFFRQFLQRDQHRLSGKAGA